MSTPASTGSDTPAWFHRPAFRYVRWSFWTLAMGLVLFGKGIPSIFSRAAERTLYFKLPIAGARFHWEFLDPEAFLGGTLTLRIINKDRDQTLVVFRDGKIQDGWEMIGEPHRNGSIYFGFATDTRVRTRYDDSLIVTLTVAKDLRGRGPYTEGVLRAGTWQMAGTYSSIYGGRGSLQDYLVLQGDAPVAYMECWRDVWPIEITRSEGWNGAAPPDADHVGFLRRLMPARGTNGQKCGSHV